MIKANQKDHRYAIDVVAMKRVFLFFFAKETCQVYVNAPNITTAFAKAGVGLELMRRMGGEYTDFEVVGGVEL